MFPAQGPFTQAHQSPKFILKLCVLQWLSEMVKCSLWNTWLDYCVSHYIIISVDLYAVFTGFYSYMFRHQLQHFRYLWNSRGWRKWQDERNGVLKWSQVSAPPSLCYLCRLLSAWAPLPSPWDVYRISPFSPAKFFNPVPTSFSQFDFLMSPPQVQSHLGHSPSLLMLSPVSVPEVSY